MPIDPEIEAPLTDEELRYFRQMKRDLQGFSRFRCWAWRVFVTLGTAGAAIAGLIAGAKAIMFLMAHGGGGLR